MIRVRSSDAVRTVTLDRPSRRNALRPADLDALAAAVAESEAVVVADEARRMGLVSRVVPSPRRVADELAENDPDALRIVGERLRDRRPVAEREAAEAAAFARLHERHAESIADSRSS